MEARRDWHLAGLILVIGVVLAAAGCGAVPAGREAGPPRADSPDLVAIHTAGSPQFRAACLGCHADVMTRTTLTPKVKDAHAAMIPFLPDYDARVGVTNETCAACHARVDLEQHSGMQIRRNADIASCEACHGATGVASRKFYVK